MATIRVVESSDGLADAWYEYDDVTMAMTAIGVTGLSGRSMRLVYIDRTGVPRTLITATTVSVAITAPRRPILSQAPLHENVLLGADLWISWE